MEQFVLGIFQEQLAKFIVGFRKEQVNANLLNGKGEIHNVELNCSALNENLSKMTPFIQLERVHVSKLSFHVTSWTNVRKAPIIVDIEDVTARAVEPLHFLDQTKRKTVQQITQSELNRLIREGLWKPRGPYNLLDRILDNLTIEIRSVKLEFQPWGKFKTTREGPWTPPQLEVSLAGIRLVSVNEYGQEASPEEVWRHNHRHHHGPHGTFLIYKKLEMEYQIAIRPCGASESTESIPLVTGRDNKLVAQIALKRRIRDGELLAVQGDVTVPKVEVDIPASVVPVLAHFVAGITYCLAKDRAFKDPLKPAGSQHDPEEPAIAMEVETNTIGEEDEGDDQGDDEGDEKEADYERDDDDEASSSSSSSSEEAQPLEKPEPAVVQNAPESSYMNLPVILLPNGMLIHESISLSVSVLHATVRGTYADDMDGHVQLIAKGCIIEAMWPKVDKTKGGYVQMSVAYTSIQERFGQQLKTILVGGVHFENNEPIEEPGKPLATVGRDETFPLFEDRSMRPDPFSLRHTFPAQAFGIKATIEFTKNVADPQKAQIMVTHEMGVDRFHILLDSGSWCRSVCFALNVKGGGFDDRWHTGDWSTLLTADMTLHPKQPLKLEECTQPTKQIFLDDNEFISSDLLNVTARFTNLDIRFPAALTEDIQSCDIVVSLNESMIVVSSALPRTLFSCNVGGNGGSGPGPDFPNDESDISNQLERSEDPSDRQRGLKSSKAISTFRFQLTVRQLSAKIVPAIPFYVFLEPQLLLAPVDLTTIVCFEGEPPPCPDSNLTKMVFFCSISGHQVDVNLDLSLLAAAGSTLLFHLSSVQNTLSEVAKILLSTQEEAEYSEFSENDVKDQITKSFRGRRALVKRQIHRSRETGGLSIVIGCQLNGIQVTCWRQNVPFQTPLRQYVFQGKNVTTSRDTSTSSKELFLPLLKLLVYQTSGLEVVFEGSFQGATRRLIAKASLQNMHIDICNLQSEIKDESQWLTSDAISALSAVDVQNPDDSLGQGNKSDEMLRIISMGNVGSRGTSVHSLSALSIRLEEVLENARFWAFSMDVSEAELLSEVERFAEALALLVELLCSPKSQEPARQHMLVASSVFPEGSLGFHLTLLLSHFLAVPDMIASPFDTSNCNQEGSYWKRLDDRIRLAIKEHVPFDLEMFLFRIGMNSVKLSLPAINGDNVQPILVLSASNFISSYFKSEVTNDSPLVNTRAAPNVVWSSFEMSGLGFSHRFQARPMIMTSAQDQKPSVSGNILPPFDIEYVSKGSGVSVVFPAGIRVEYVSSFQILSDSLEILAVRLNSVRSTAKKLRFVISGKKVDKSAGKVVRTIPPEIASITSAESTQFARIAASEVYAILLERNNKLKERFDEKDRIIRDLKRTVFRAEKERFGVMSMVISQALGWLRIGSAQRTGLRGLLACTLLPHWIALRRSYMIVYSKPESNKPLAVISLRGAALHELSGGRRKRDVKRAFAVVERSGTVFFLLADSDADYYKWTRELNRTIVECAGDHMSSDAEESNSVKRENEDTPSRKKPVGRSVTKVVQAAKATGHAVAERRRRILGINDSVDDSSRTGDTTVASQDDIVGTSSTNAIEFRPIDQESGLDEASLGQPGSKRRQMLKNRFANVRATVGQATKSRLGNAIQAAKDKGRSIADNRRQRNETNSEAGSREFERLPTAFDQEHPPWLCPRCTFQNEGLTNICSMCSALRQEIESIPGDPTAVADMRGDEGRICVACTFLNSGDAVVCMMCSAVFKEDEVLTPGKVDASDLLASTSNKLSICDTGEVIGKDETIFSDEGTEIARDESGRIRLKMKERIGAAVRTVRGGKASETEDAGFESSRNRNLFGLRSQGQADDSTGHAGSILRMKQISLGKKLVPSHPFGDPTPDSPDINLKTLEGFWCVHVECAPPEKSKTVNMDATVVGESKQSNISEIESLTDNDANIGKEQISSTRELHSSQTIDMVDVSESEPVFEFQLFKWTNSVSSPKENHGKFKKSFTDVLDFYTSLSESVSKIPSSPYYQTENSARTKSNGMNNSLARELGLTTTETIRLAGRLLGGVLQLIEEQPDRSCYDLYTSITSEFFNSVLDCPLPVDGLALLTDFLFITDASTKSVTTEDCHPPASRNGFDPVESAKGPLTDVLMLADICNARLSQAHQQGLLAQEVLRATVNGMLETDDGFPSHSIEFRDLVLNSSAPTHFRETLHDELLKIMEERDEAHSRMVASGVLHVHEMEQQRKKVHHLKAQLDAVKQMAQNNGSTLFGGDDSASNPANNLRKYEREMQQNSDAELLSLCQQLASEISARTSTALEVVRLKEIRKLEKESEAAEKRALLEELADLKRELAKERLKAQDAQESAENWKKSFDAAIAVNKLVKDGSFANK